MSLYVFKVQCSIRRRYCEEHAFSVEKIHEKWKYVFECLITNSMHKIWSGIARKPINQLSFINTQFYLG